MTPLASRRRVVPARAIPGGRVVDRGRRAPFAVDPLPRVRFGAAEARLSSASSRRLVAVVPPAACGGRRRRSRSATRTRRSGIVEVGTPRRRPSCTRWTARRSIATATSTSPSAARAASAVPVSIFRVRPDGDPRAVRLGHRQRHVAGVRPVRRAVRDEPVRRRGLPREARRHDREDRVGPRRGVRPRVRAGRDDVRRRPDRDAVPRERGRAGRARSPRCRRASRPFTWPSARTRRCT